MNSSKTNMKMTELRKEFRENEESWLWYDETAGFIRPH